MGPAQAIKSCFGKYVTFSGRALRSELWWFCITVTSVEIVLSIAGLESLQSLFFLATFLPMLAAIWRRMHDADSTGALVLLPIATMIGGVYIQLFAMLVPLQKVMANIEFTPDTTLREIQKKMNAANLAGSFSGPPTMSFFAVLVGCAGGLWLIYLLARPTSPGPNRFGPNPSEVTP